jgi:hypothetical protein
MNVSTSKSERKESKNLSDAEKARLAGAIWFYGSIDIERSRERGYYYPRIVITMPNPLPYMLREDVGGGVVYPGKRELRRGRREVEKQFTLMIKKQALVEKLLKEIKGIVGGFEEEQIGIALEIFDVKRSKGKDEKERLKELFEEWKQKRVELEKWVKAFKAKYRDVEEKRIPVKIWNRAYLLEDC